METYRSALVHLIMEEGGGKFAEIGVLKGKTCRNTLFHCGAIIDEYWAIDPWAVVEYGKRKRWSQARWDNNHAIVLKLTEKYLQLRILRVTSAIAAKIAQEEGLKFDIVFIDGDHSYEAVVDDILCWKPLVRKGGLLTGHDYGTSNKGVARAVDELLGAKNVEIFPNIMVWTYRV